MSTSETVEYKIGMCPCGKGGVIKTMVTQDNPWSSADISYHIDCTQCQGAWELSRTGDRLTLRSSTIPAERAGKVLMAAQCDADAYVRDLAARYFEAKSFPTKKAEHAHLVELKIANGSYRTYLQDRKLSTIDKVGHPGRNPAFVGQLVSTFGDKAHHDMLLGKIAEADAVYKAAAAKIVRHDVKL